MPLPPYIWYDKSKEKDYQTVFAEQAWSVAAPTASLHFTDRVLSTLSAIWVDTATCLLHVWLGTFKQVDVEDITDYDIHSEQAEVTTQLFETIAAKKIANHPVIWVGTTVTRTLESMPYLWAWLPDEEKSRCSQAAAIWRDNLTSTITQEKTTQYIKSVTPTKTGRKIDTALYITPWSTFYVIDELITNFHLPKSSLLMLVAAFVWYKQMRALYDHAIATSYRFYSFGDAMYLKQ